jgi:hypothetical protein
MMREGGGMMEAGGSMKAGGVVMAEDEREHNSRTGGMIVRRQV